MQSVLLNQMNRLLLPAYLLTGSQEKAAQCFLEACEDCIDTRQENFEGVKRAVVKAAIRRIAADLTKYVPEGTPRAAGREEIADALRKRDETHTSAASFRRELLTLNTFQRAALVLRLYERYSAAEAASLLRVSRQTLENGWQQALIALVSRLNPRLTGETTGIGNTDTLEEAFHINV
jgi:DNA-directed RNA polymerase specialized sigma24 family protein